MAVRAPTPVVLDGDYASASFPTGTFSPSTLVSVETIMVSAGNNYTLQAQGFTTQAAIAIDATALGSANHIDFETSGGRFNVTGGAGNDIINFNGVDVTNNVIDGGDGNDSIGAGLGNDTINGGNGDDTILFAFQRRAELRGQDRRRRGQRHRPADGRLFRRRDVQSRDDGQCRNDRPDRREARPSYKMRRTTRRWRRARH